MRIRCTFTRVRTRHSEVQCVTLGTMCNHVQVPSNMLPCHNVQWLRQDTTKLVPMRRRCSWCRCQPSLNRTAIIGFLNVNYCKKFVKKQKAWMNEHFPYAVMSKNGNKHTTRTYFMYGYMCVPHLQPKKTTELLRKSIREATYIRVPHLQPNKPNKPQNF